MRFDDGTTVELHVLSIIECYSRVILAAVLAPAEDRKATIAVLEKAIARWGLPTRIQYDRGSAFDSRDVRHAIAQLSCLTLFGTRFPVPMARSWTAAGACGTGGRGSFSPAS